MSKQILDIDPQAPAIMFGANGINSPYKGLNYLKQALKILHHYQDMKHLIPLVFGGGQDALISEKLPFNVTFLGFLKDELSLNMALNAADVFVVPSVPEAFGYVVMEALSCANPVVGYKVGGIPDQIKHLGNGYLANPGDPFDLANGIKYRIQSKLKGYLLTSFDSENILIQHNDLFESVLY